MTRSEFAREASAIDSGGACCVFVIDGSIPEKAQAGYAALVIAYARAHEPVLILEDGAAALLVREGGRDAAQVVALRVLGQMRRLSLEQTLRAGVSDLRGDSDAALLAARRAAEATEAGGVAVGT